MGPFAVVLEGLAILYVSSFAHELGHAVLGRMAGYTVTSFGLGTGRPWCVVRVGRARAYLGLVRPFQGIAFVCMSHRDASRREQAALMAGGILANGLLAMVGLGSWLAWGGAFWMTVAWVNAVLACVNLIPLRGRIGTATVRSDGWHLLKIWRSGSPPTPAPLTIQMLDAFRPLWTATGDTLALRVFLASAAESWACLGELGRAEELVAEAESLPPPDVPGLAALGTVVRAGVAIEAGRLAEAAEAIDAAEGDYRALGHEGGQFSAALLRARLRRHAGDAPGACDSLEALAAHPALVGHPARAASFVAERLITAIAAGDAEAVASLRARYERARAGHPSTATDLTVFAELARFAAARDDWADAAPLYRRAMEAVASLAKSWNVPGERARFLESRAALLEEAREALRMTGGDPDEAERLIPKAGPPTPADLEARDRRLRRVGYRVLVVNAACAAGVIWLGAEVGLRAFGVFVVVPLAFTLFTAAGVGYLAFDRTVGRFIPPLRRSGGAVILMMGGMAWLCAIMALVMAVAAPDRRP